MLQRYFLSVFDPLGIYITEVELRFNNIYYLKGNLLYLVSVVFWVGIVFYGHLQLIRFYKSMPLIKKAQTIYFLIGMIVGFSGGLTYFLPMFGLNIYPIGNITIPRYCIIVTFAILKYRLLDVNVALTRTGIFVGVYSDKTFKIDCYPTFFVSF